MYFSFHFFFFLQYIYIYIYYIYIYIYKYIVIHRQICFILLEFISVARQARFPKLGSKPSWLKRQSKILPLSHEEASASKVNLNGYKSQLLLFTYIHLTVTKSSIHMKSFVCVYIYIYIYIYMHVSVFMNSSYIYIIYIYELLIYIYKWGSFNK